MVNILGVAFPLQQIQEAMLETGGTVVAQLDLVNALERERKRIESSGKRCDTLALSKIPGVYFVPKKFTVHSGVPGTPIFDVGGRESRRCLWFAVNRGFRGASMPRRSD